jgi:hypothetical protein
MDQGPRLGQLIEAGDRRGGTPSTLPSPRSGPQIGLRLANTSGWSGTAAAPVKEKLL